MECLNVYLCFVYRPPNGDLRQFLIIVDNTLSILAGKRRHVILLGGNRFEQNNNKFI